MKTWLVVVALGCVAGRPAYGQTAPPTPCSPPLTEVRQLVERTFAETKDAAQTLAVAKQALHLNEMGLSIATTEDIDIAAVSAHAAYYTGLSEALRKRDPIAEIPMAPGDILINVKALTINAPNIEKVIVERGGEMVKPTLSTLKPETMATRLGAKFVTSEGVVAFPCSAFVAGAPVVVTAIPSSGTNFEKKLDNYDLRVLTLGRGRAPE